MSLLWAVPPFAVVGAMVVLLWQLRDLTEAAGELHGELQRFGEVQLAVADVRAAATEARTSMRQLHQG
jgi:hypothetical protein